MATGNFLGFGGADAIVEIVLGGLGFDTNERPEERALLLKELHKSSAVVVDECRINLNGHLGTLPTSVSTNQLELP